MTSPSNHDVHLKHQHGTEQREVEVRLPAAGEFVAPLRALTRSLSAQCDLTVDDIEDLQIAVTESCALLLPHARVDEPWIVARFLLSAGKVEVEVRVSAARGAEPDRTGFSWTALIALADEVDVRSSGEELSICLIKLREAQQQ